MELERDEAEVVGLREKFPYRHGRNGANADDHMPNPQATDGNDKSDPQASRCGGQGHSIKVTQLQQFVVACMNAADSSMGHVGLYASQQDWQLLIPRQRPSSPEQAVTFLQPPASHAARIKADPRAHGLPRPRGRVGKQSDVTIPTSNKNPALRLSAGIGWPRPTQARASAVAM